MKIEGGVNPHIQAPNFVSEGLGALARLLDQNNMKAENCFILVDENTQQHCLAVLQEEVQLLKKAKVILIRSGEGEKSLDTCARIWEKLANELADRQSVLINLGGGVIGDVGGFSAATYKRGIRFIQLPTSLLAQVDASVGGKTGFNFKGYKNLIGTFSAPLAVFIYPEFLKTLPKKQVLSGFAEIIKHALIADAQYWEEIRKADINKAHELGSLIQKSIDIKMRIVTEDPLEQGNRKLLNFGHTIGHALESESLISNHPLTHGEAIAIGMVCEAYLSHIKNGLDQQALDQICSFILSHYSGYTIANDELPQLIELMKNDKKNNENQFKMVLLNAIGSAGYDHSIPRDLILESIQYYKDKVAAISR